MKTHAFYCSALLLLGLTLPSPGQEWTRFRGPNGTGISDAKTIPTKWTDQDINWKVSLPGIGHSSPVVWGDRIFLTGTEAVPNKISVLALKTNDGSVLWRKDFPYQPFDKHEFNSFASPTPAVDGERVYVAWSTPERYTLIAFDHSGKTVWERDLGAFKSQHGCGTSPIVYQDKVILGNDQDGASSLIAVDAKTGQTKWQIPRQTAVAAYSTPCVYQAAGQKPALIFNSQAHGVTAIDPDNGKVLWEYDKAFDKRSVSSPIVASGLIIGSCGSGAGGNYVAAVRPGGNGKKPELAYELRSSAPYVPTGVAVGDLLFLWADSGVVSCLHAPTGEVKWQERAGGNFFGSPVCVDGRLFCVSTSGEVVVLEAAAKFNVLARYPLGELTHSTPAVAGGRMYVRTAGHLFSIGGKAKEATLR
jgi:outer membrane protein assembly factor BamB